MKKVFLKDLSNNRIITWDYLLDDISTTVSFNPYCFSKDYYVVFKNIILSLLLKEKIVLLDSDFSESELLKLTGKSDFDIFNRTIIFEEELKFSSWSALIDELKRRTHLWSITLFTSGTTGLPKKVKHNFETISRFIKINESHRNDVWGFAYNPTHMAGLQVFFQAFFNGNSIIRLFGLKNKDIYSEIRNSDITHISATPTFYKLLLPCSEIFQTILRITSGGEKFNQTTFHRIREMFPNAKITNVYASTEAGTLFASQNDIFCIRSEFEDKIQVKDNELYIHRSLTGLNKKRYEEWHKTGDLVEVVDINPLRIKFISRKTDVINVGGYNVNPIEVEETLLKMEGVINVRVFSKSNSVLGSIVCCDVMVNNDLVSEFSIRSFLQSKLQEYKIPRVIQLVERLSTTRTGKLIRN